MGNKSTKNIRYVVIGAIVVVLAVVLICYSIGSKKSKDSAAVGNEPTVTGSSVATGDAAEEKSTGFYSNADITSFITDYLTAYGNGKVKQLKEMKSPISKEERKMIKAFSKYVDHYDNIKCYVKDGPKEKTYMVSASYDCYFKDIATAVPGLQTFYIYTNEEGTFVIDGRTEEELDTEEQAYFLSYGEASDVSSLVADVNKRYSEVLASDEAVRVLVEETIPNAVAAQPDETDSETEEPVNEVSEDAPAQNTTEESEGNTNEAVSQEIVYTTDDVRIRAEAGEDAEQIGSALKGDSFVRVESLDDGWSKILYNGQNAYIKSDYLTTSQVLPDEKPVVEEESDEVDEESATVTSKYHQEGQEITVHDALNIRASMSSESDILTTTSDGDVVTVILDYEEGWTKVTFGEITGYIKTEYLD